MNATTKCTGKRSASSAVAEAVVLSSACANSDQLSNVLTVSVRSKEVRELHRLSEAQNIAKNWILWQLPKPLFKWGVNDRC
jgi:hypothetical protein